MEQEKQYAKIYLQCLQAVGSIITDGKEKMILDGHNLKIFNEIESELDSLRKGPQFVLATSTADGELTQ